MSGVLSPAAGTLLERCTSMGVEGWLFDETGRAVHTPRDDDRLMRRLAHIASATNTRLREHDPIDLGDDCAALPVVLPQAHEPALIVLALIRAGGDPELPRILRWMGSDLGRTEEQDRSILDLSDQLVNSYEQVMTFYRIGRSMNGLEDPRQFIVSTCEQVREVLGYAWISVCYVRSPLALSQIEHDCIVAGEIGARADDFAAIARQSLQTMSHDSWTSVLDPGGHPLADLTETQIVLEPIVHDGVIIGALLAGGKQSDDPEVSSIDTQLLDTVADLLGVFHQNASRFEVQRTLFMGTVSALSAAIDAKHRYTHGHSTRVALLSREMARQIGLPEEVVERVHIAGIVHDIGKIGVPEATLSKTGRLTDEEFEQIKLHPVVGYDILKGIPPMQDILPGVLYHHERWDGGGYPEGRAGEDIPLFGRIIAEADAFDAMSSTRSYRDELPRDEVFRRLREGAGTQWEARLIDAFFQIDLTEYDNLISAARQTGAEQPENNPGHL